MTNHRYQAHASWAGQKRLFLASPYTDKSAVVSEKFFTSVIEDMYNRTFLAQGKEVVPVTVNFSGEELEEFKKQHRIQQRSRKKRSTI